MIRDGDTGFLTHPGDEEELAEKMQILLDDEKLRLEIGKRAGERILQDFTWEKVADRLQKVYSHTGGGARL